MPKVDHRFGPPEYNVGHGGGGLGSLGGLGIGLGGGLGGLGGHNLVFVLVLMLNDLGLILMLALKNGIRLLGHAVNPDCRDLPLGGFYVALKEGNPRFGGHW